MKRDWQDTLEKRQQQRKRHYQMISDGTISSPTLIKRTFRPKATYRKRTAAPVYDQHPPIPQRAQPNRISYEPPRPLVRANSVYDNSKSPYGIADELLKEQLKKKGK